MKISFKPLSATTLLVWIALNLSGCKQEEPANHDHEAEHAEEEIIRGPQGGRVLTDGRFTVELLIFESGVPPEFHAWVRVDGKPIPPTQVKLQVELKRLGGGVDRIGFAPKGEFLRGDRIVEEPHSFDVKVTATHAGRTHAWTYESHEGRTTIEPAMAREAGLESAEAGPGVITETISLHGVIGPDTTRVRAVGARFPGVVRTVSRQIGDRVTAGAVLATVESNDSLQTYAITAPIAGIVTRRHAETGQQTDDDALFEVADFSTVWAEFSVFPRDRARLREGQRVSVATDAGKPETGTLSHISPLGNRGSQSVTARVVLDNADSRWTPGQFVDGRVVVAETPVALAVPLSALQSFRDFTVVFAQVDDTYEVRMLELGRRDLERVEVLKGLAPGTRYVTQNSYLIKADIEKSGASHDH